MIETHQTRDELKSPSRCRLWRITVVAGIVAAGCLPQAENFAGSGNADDLSVVLVGDSLVFLAQNGTPISNEDTNVTDAILGPAPDGTERSQVAISAMIGAVTGDTDQTNPNSNFEGFDFDPDVAVFALGTNDARIDVQTGLPNVSIADAQQNLENFIAETNPGCTVLVEVAETQPWGLDVTGVAWNDGVLASIAAAEPSKFVVVDWAQTATSGDFLMPDGVHHTPIGREAYIAEILGGIEQCDSLLKAT